MKDHFFRSRHWTVVSVDPLREKLTPDLNCKFLVIGDTKNTPPEIEISPVTLSADLDALILLARCINPPFYLAQGQVIAQAIPIPSGIPVDDAAPQIYWAQAVGENKPIISCHLKKGSEGMGMTGMIDTGADVTVIPERRWPPQWELQPMVSHIQGIGGAQLAKISKEPIQIRGPDGQIASIRPIVTDFQVPLWGRDVMSQWGVRIEIPKTPQDF